MRRDTRFVSYPSSPCLTQILREDACLFRFPDVGCRNSDCAYLLRPPVRTISFFNFTRIIGSRCLALIVTLRTPSIKFSISATDISPLCLFKCLLDAVFFKRRRQFAPTRCACTTPPPCLFSVYFYCCFRCFPPPPLQHEAVDPTVGGRTNCSLLRCCPSIPSLDPWYPTFEKVSSSLLELPRRHFFLLFLYTRNSFCDSLRLPLCSPFPIYFSRLNRSRP